MKPHHLAHCSAWRGRGGSRAAACLLALEAGKALARCPQCARLQLEIERAERTEALRSLKVGTR